MRIKIAADFVPASQAPRKSAIVNHQIFRNKLAISGRALLFVANRTPGHRRCDNRTARQSRCKSVFGFLKGKKKFAGLVLADMPGDLPQFNNMSEAAAKLPAKKNAKSQVSPKKRDCKKMQLPLMASAINQAGSK